MPIPHLTHFTGSESALGNKMAQQHVDALNLLKSGHPVFGSQPGDQGQQTYEVNMHVAYMDQMGLKK